MDLHCPLFDCHRDFRKLLEPCDGLLRLAVEEPVIVALRFLQEARRLLESAEVGAQSCRLLAPSLLDAIWLSGDHLQSPRRVPR
ncbi:hypothetical protein IST455A_00886 [Burkholderia multivorans]|nr:hypothetical protein IST419_01014 [Burkholderia multivorans]CAB5311365.1 hypothetical protein IST455A_00886 [Burkholderia multivorans]CAB5312703.1 hypothetical protein IST455B_00798 [Burkholderia multivorans]CAB5317723.1 hypothetical protein IST495B_01102 [Burkholderia multivorans]CAB5336214.1 hypothetical protein IST4119_01296 [Burkholderia multivorans]